ncbi:MAG: hypothetical protein JNN00_07465 [Chitinophagaceae bacterium]|nr:hypothetical protein [Chitinophagaceae bacterium]
MKAIKLSKELREQLLTFLENYPPQQFSSFLRNVLLDYIRTNIDIGLNIEFGRFLCAMEALFDLLDSAAQQQQKKK